MTVIRISLCVYDYWLCTHGLRRSLLTPRALNPLHLTPTALGPLLPNVLMELPADLQRHMRGARALGLEERRFYMYKIASIKLHAVVSIYSCPGGRAPKMFSILLSPRS